MAAVGNDESSEPGKLCDTAPKWLHAEMTDEWTRYYREPAWHDLEVLHAHFVEHTFARHSHPYFVIGYVETGVQSYNYRGARHLTPAGQVFLVNPEEMHTGEAATAQGYVYRTVYPRPALLEQVAEDATGRRAIPFFRQAVIRDSDLTYLLVAFHQATAESTAKLATESLLTKALVRLIVRHADDRFSCTPVGRERSAVRRVRECIDANFARNLTLSELGQLAGLSAFHLVRAFEKDVGLPPHVYLEMARHRRARQLLDANHAIADVAAAVGYADQSHFTHRFKRFFGITPGQFKQARKRRVANRIRNS
jgi:AraC-like DNA-binding protein